MKRPMRQPTDIAYDYLVEIISSLKPGEKLPPMRQLSKDCDVSLPVLGRVLERLKNGGAVEMRPRSGVFKCGDVQNGNSNLHILFFDSPDTLRPNNYIEDLFGYLVRLLGHRLHIWLMCDEDSQVQLYSLLQSERPRVIFTYALRANNMTTVSRIAEMGIQQIHMMPNQVEPLRPCVVVDNDAIIRTQLESLVAAGHRKIGYLHAVNPSYIRRDHYLRYNAFFRIAMEMGLLISPDWVRHVEFDAELTKQATLEMFRSKNPPTALIINDSYAQAVYSALGELKLVPGRDVGIVGTDDMPWAAQIYPSLSSVSISRRLLAQEVIALFEQVTANPASLDFNRVCLLKTSFVERQSTRKDW